MVSAYSAKTDAEGREIPKRRRVIVKRKCARIAVEADIVLSGKGDDGRSIPNSGKRDPGEQEKTILIQDYGEIEFYMAFPKFCLVIGSNFLLNGYCLLQDQE